MTIIVTGARGQLGAELCRQFGTGAIGFDRHELDVTDQRAVRRCLDEMRPTGVINCAGYTQVDRAEEETKQCWQVNADAVGHLAEACRRLDCVFVQISTDYVFGADEMQRTPYRETDSTGPLGTYAKSKLAGEQQAAACPRHFIVRSCGLYGLPAASRESDNFVETMLRLAEKRDCLRVVADQHCTPTSTSQLARAIIFLMQTAEYGIYHITNEGATTWYEFAAEIFRRTNAHVRLEHISSTEFAAPAQRPLYSVLNISKYAALSGPPMNDWKTALAEYLAVRQNK